MPVRSRHSRDEHQRMRPSYESDYSFKTRDYSSRDFARSRRFGDDPTDDSRTMSYVSSPLQMSIVGSRRTFSPYRTNRSYNGYNESDEEDQPSYSRYEERSRKQERQPRRNPYIEEDEDDDEFLVPTFVPRRRPDVNVYRPNPRFTAARQTRRGTPDVDEDFESTPRKPISTHRSMGSRQRQRDEDEYSYRVESPEEEEFRRRFNREEVKQEFDDDHMEEEEEVPRQQPPRRQQQKVVEDEEEEQQNESYRYRKRQPYNDPLSTDLGYIVPASRRREDPSEENDDASMRRMAGYIAKRKEFAVEDEEEMQHLRNSGYQYRILGNAYPLVTNAAAEQRMDKEKLNKAPMFDMKLRSHVSWEKMNVKFMCKVRGHPQPTITWYHNMVPVAASASDPGKFRITNQFGIHCLEINRVTLEDSGTYRVSAQNHKGEISCYATLLVRRYDGSRLGRFDPSTGTYNRYAVDFPDVEKLDIPGYPRFVQKLWNTSAFEGDAIILSCKVDGKPFPDVFWTLNGKPLDNQPNHVIIGYDKGIATVTILQTYTDDEGEYSCRAFNSCGASTSKCYLRVNGRNSPPSAPSCISFTEVTRNGAIMTWKRPGYLGHFGGSPIQGYIIERAEAGSSVWKRHSKDMFKMTQTPLTGLKEEGIYFFRVRAVTDWGTSRPSLPAGPLILRDPGAPRTVEALVDPETLVPPETDDISVEEEDVCDLPGIPTDVEVDTRGDAIIIYWKAPDSEEVEANGYFIEYCENDSDDWVQITNESLKSVDPYPVTGLESGKEYRFRVLAENDAGISDPSESAVVYFSFQTQEDQQPIECPDDNKEEYVEVPVVEEEGDATDEIKSVRSNVSSKSNKEEKIVKDRSPAAPTEVKALKVTREFIEVCWMPPFSGGENLGYFIEISENDSLSWKICNQLPARFTRYPVTPLKEGATYVFRVRAVNEFGTSDFSSQSDPIVAQDSISESMRKKYDQSTIFAHLEPPSWWGGMIKSFRVASNEYGLPSVTRNSIKVCWDEPNTDGGSPVLGYFLEYRPRGGKYKPANNKALSQRHITVGDLKEGLEYEFRVCAFNIAGSGEFKELPVPIMAKDPDVPACPTDLKITGVTDESVTLEWKKPEKIGQGTFLGYIVERNKEGSSIWIPCNKTPEEVEDVSYLVDGLITGETYFFRVVAVSTVGRSICSLQSAFVTPGENLDDVLDRQGAMAQRLKEIEWKKQEEERLREEEDLKQAFVKGIEECSVALGGKARFECVVKKRSTDVDWFFGNWKETEVKPEGKYDVIAAGKSRALIISKCQLSDVNVVHCVARYNGCSTSAYLIVDGMVPCVFIQEPEDIECDSTSTIKFECVMTRDDAKVTWWKYGEKITESNDKYNVVTEGSTHYLVIKDVDLNDIGEYTVGGLGGKVKVHLIVDDVIPAQFESDIEGGEYKYDAGVAEFSTSVNPSDLYKDGDLPECVWYHNGERIEVGDDKYEIVQDGNKHILKILNLNHEDSGIISCCCGGSETECGINVERPPPPPPTPTPMRVMTDRPEDIVINFKQALKPEALTNSMRLFCAVTSIPDDIKIMWYYNDQKLEIDNKKYRSLNDPESGFVTLIVEDLCADDGLARYTCELISPLKMFDSKVHYVFENGDFDVIMEQAKMMKEEEEKGKQAALEERQRKRQALKNKRMGKGSSSTCQTPVQSKPETAFSSDGMLYEVNSDGDIVLFVEGEEFHAKEVVWMKNSEVINDERFITSNLPGKLSLTIKNPEEDDAGTFTCQIKTSSRAIETSSDITGKVFKQLLKTSAERRIMQTTINEHCDVTDDELEKEEALPELEGCCLKDTNEETVVSSTATAEVPALQDNVEKEAGPEEQIQSEDKIVPEINITET